MKTINIAIDGPAGAGKSTIAKLAAKELGYIYVDTGALYRTTALYMHENGLTETADIIAALDKCDVKLKYTDGQQRVFLGGRDVSEEIRKPEVSMAASRVSAIPQVREHLFNLQKKMAEENNVIMDGRDIGTVVLPNADVKIFLTATAEERANRRYKELSEKSNCPCYEEILSDIKERDKNDMNRPVAPLKQADDAVLVDSTHLTLQQSADKIRDIILEKTGER